MAGKRTVGQQRIVDAARQIIISRGLENLTVREIARVMRITDGALYRHFKGKREIISLLIDDIEETLITAVDEAAAMSEDPVKKLKNIFWSHLSYAEERKGVSFIVISNLMSMKDKRLQGKAYQVVNKYLNRIKRILKSGAVKGKVRKTISLEAASIAFFGIIQCMVTMWGLSGYKYSLGKNRVEEAFDFFMKGILVKK